VSGTLSTWTDVPTAPTMSPPSESPDLSLGLLPLDLFQCRDVLPACCWAFGFLTFVFGHHGPYPTPASSGKLSQGQALATRTALHTGLRQQKKYPPQVAF
jgi:hypothetical protein